MNLRHLNNDSLLSEVRKLVQEERRVSLDLLYHLREIERRLLHAELGFSSLYEYVTRGLGYSEAAAHRRIQSARLLAECPELAPKIESGSLNLSLLAQVQTFCRNEDVKSTEKKREILQAVENKSSREAEKKLMSMTSEPAKHKPERKKQVSEKYSEIRFMADASFVAQLEELKALLGARTYQQASAYALKAGLDKKRPKAPKPKTETLKTSLDPQQSSASDSVEIATPTSSPLVHMQVTPPFKTAPRPGTIFENESPSMPPTVSDSHPTPEVTSRYIPVEVKRRVWARDQGQCTYRGAQSGTRCQSKFGLEYDHFITPFALGGKATFDNLTLRCKAHNQLGAIAALGFPKMARHMAKLN